MDTIDTEHEPNIVVVTSHTRSTPAWLAHLKRKRADVVATCCISICFLVFLGGLVMVSMYYDQILEYNIKCEGHIDETLGVMLNFITDDYDHYLKINPTFNISRHVVRGFYHAMDRIDINCTNVGFDSTSRPNFVYIQLCGVMVIGLSNEMMLIESTITKYQNTSVYLDMDVVFDPTEEVGPQMLHGLHNAITFIDHYTTKFNMQTSRKCRGV
jgi:hypothetical protein